MLILDARSYTAAWANRAKGGGFESTGEHRFAMFVSQAMSDTRLTSEIYTMSLCFLLFLLMLMFWPLLSNHSRIKQAKPPQVCTHSFLEALAKTK